MMETVNQISKEDNRVFLSVTVLLKDFMPRASNNLRYTIYTFKRGSNKYAVSSVQNLPSNARRLNSFLSRNGKNHKVVYYTLDGDKMEVYTSLL